MLFDAGDGPFDGDPDLVYCERFRRHALDLTPEATRPDVPVRLAGDGVTLICDGGLPHLRWVLSDGLNALRLQQEGPLIEMLSAFQRTAGMSSERLFDYGFLDARVAGQRHAFDQVRLTHYGYENHRRADDRTSWGAPDSFGIRAAEAVRDTHPDRAIEIWKAAAERQIALTRPQAYEVAGRYLRQVRELVPGAWLVDLGGGATT